MIIVNYTGTTVSAVVDSSVQKQIEAGQLVAELPNGKVVPYDAVTTSIAIGVQIIVPFGVALKNGQAGWTIPVALVTVPGAPSADGSIALYTLDPRQFGAFWDNVHDDGPALQAMIDSIPLGGGFGAGLVVIDLPTGMGFCGRNLYINRSVHMRGKSAGGDGVISGIRFGPGYGMFLDGYQVRHGVATVGPSQGSANDSIIEKMQLRSQALSYKEGDEFSIGTHRFPSTYYALGEARIKDSFTAGGANTTCFFRVTVEGTTGSGAEPVGFAGTTGGVSFVDGGVTWTAEKFPKDRLSNHPYVLGDRIFIPGDNRWIWECTTPGTSSMTTPLYTLPGTYQDVGPDYTSPRAVYRDTTTDGTAVFTAKTHAGILCTSVACRIRDINIAGFTGYALHCDADGFSTPPTYGSFQVWGPGKLQACGGGVIFNGGDTSGSQVRDITTLSLALLRTNIGAPNGQGGFSVWDRGLSSSALNCYAQASLSPDIVTGTSSNFIAFGCRSENTLGSILRGSGDLWLGFGAIQPQYAYSIGRVYGNSGNRRLQSIDGALTFAVDIQDGASGYSITDSDSAGQSYAWRYDSTSGEWRYQWAFQNAQNCFGVTNSKAGGTGTTLGSGNWIDYRGHWCGKATAQYFLGTDAAAKTDANVAYGTRALGFRFEAANANPLTGTSIGQVASVAGYDGVPRTNGMSGIVAVPSWGIPPTTISIGGNVYKCTTAGVAAGSPPAFDSVPGHTTNDGGIVWTCLGPAASYSSYGKVYNAGTLTKATAGAYALSTYEAAYECIEATGAAANITVTSAYDGQTLVVYNNSGGNITVVGFTVTTGQLLTAQYIGGGVAAWKRKALI